MTPSFHAHLVNGRSGDAALYVDHRFERRALLFDIGDIRALPPRKLLRVSHVFVSHAHLDHFIGFDQLLRVSLRRDVELRFFGPIGLADRIEAKLGGYTWNLVDRFATNLRLTVCEIDETGEARRARFELRHAFEREDLEARTLEGDAILRTKLFNVTAVVLDHKTPCLGFAVAEPVHVNIWRNRLDELGLAVGPWLNALKQAVMAGEPDDAPIKILRRDDGGTRADVAPLGELRQTLHVIPGQKIAYVTDVVFNDTNVAKIETLARDADTFFIEACFAAEDEALAAERAHLTTRQAGQLAARAGARRVEPFHFSSRYEGQEARLLDQVETAFREGAPASSFAARDDT
ncbi:MAG: MBL fold metallo-hydrolase [Maricaulaceae bacterium]